MSANTDKLNLELSILIESISLTLDGWVPNQRVHEWRNKVAACNVDLLLRLANHHGLVPWLALSLKSELGSIGKNADTGLSQIYKLNQMLRFKSEHQTKAAVFTSKQFSQKQLPHVVFKGSALLHQIYPDFLLSRTSDDLDILVAPATLGEAVSLLEVHGYKAQKLDDIDAKTFSEFIAKHSKWFRFRDLTLLRAEGVPHHIDLHWRIADSFSFTADTETLIDDYAVVNTQYGEIRTLPLDKHFVYLCSHGYSDYYFRLRYLVDVYMAMIHDDFNKQSVLKFARECGVLKQVEQSMQLADYFFGVGDKGRPINKYTALIIQRLMQSNGLTVRIHPNIGAWTRADKVNHLMRQIRNRSAKSYWFSPILARTKLGTSDLKGWQGNRGSGLLFYLSRLPEKLVGKKK